MHFQRLYNYIVNFTTSCVSRWIWIVVWSHLLWARRILLNILRKVCLLTRIFSKFAYQEASSLRLCVWKITLVGPGFWIGVFLFFNYFAFYSTAFDLYCFWWGVKLSILLGLFCKWWVTFLLYLWMFSLLLALVFLCDVFIVNLWIYLSGWLLNFLCM